MPFIETAVLGSPGAPELPEGDYINHFNGLRIRVTGSGVLRGTIYGTDKVISAATPNIIMASTNEIVPYRIVNLVSQRCSLRLETTEIDEIFRINRITFYARPVFAMAPA